MRRSLRVMSLLLGVSLLAALVGAPSPSNAAPARDDANTLTIWDNAAMWQGFTAASLHNTSSIAAYYRYYGTLWKKRFPNLVIHEVVTKDMADLTAKLLLAVNAGNPPDLVGTDAYLGTLVTRKAVQNLDSYYKRDNISASIFLPAMADFTRVNGHWYGIPAASDPTQGDLLYIPAYVKAAGLDPNNIPQTWDGLWQATQKVTQFDAHHKLTRIGLPVTGTDSSAINQFCGAFVTYEPKTAKFHANLPCEKAYFTFEKRLTDFYGGTAKYTAFSGADPQVWSCSSKAYLPAGKELFHFEAYWIGTQMDTCYPQEWAMSWAPTPHGTMAERKSVKVTAWQVNIPTGAKHALLAFEFAKYTLWDNGYVAGPTTNGFVLANQSDLWATNLIKVEGQIRQSHHYKGNPIIAASAIVAKESKIGQVSTPTDVANAYFGQQMTLAWDQIRFGRQSVDQALDQVQRLVDSKQKALHAQAGM